MSQKHTANQINGKTANLKSRRKRLARLATFSNRASKQPIYGPEKKL
jgi:hypothetical protein